MQPSQREPNDSQFCSNALETALLLGDFERAVELARRFQTCVNSRQEYAICLCVEIQALFELGREKEALDIATQCVVENGIAFENFSLLNTCVSLFLVLPEESGLEWAETTLQRWCKSQLSNGVAFGFSVEQRKHLWEVLLFHVLAQRGLTGIQKGLDKVNNELSEWGFDREWLGCMERELMKKKKEVLEKEYPWGTGHMEESEEPFDSCLEENSSTAVVVRDDNVTLDSITERNDESLWSKTWTIVQQVDSPLFRVSVVTALCLLFYSLKRKCRVNRPKSSGGTVLRPWLQQWMDIFRMAFGLSYGRPGI
ncbi:hypothetical protein GpartN1_g3477.t1 [Galdieria partita]|uniref:Uncharacterized protein n=1 Tax=Galdieria partita TaxID=83374 RepID=A0A9C7PXI7_9RHOD|nr:hypothetical protein GpartN1_g3477.t1 [Galdieria partita]